MTADRGIVAAGHPVTAQAAAEILKVGGNAFDAALAALFASCVAEPVLASLGGGGFMLARQQDKPPLLYDFFTQTPRSKAPPEACDFYPIIADFGTAQQEFHIGMGAIATPGVVKGLFQLHRDLCSLPLELIIQPACEAARAGIEINQLQHYIAEIVSPIILSTPEALLLHQGPDSSGSIANAGERVFQKPQADIFEHLAAEGEALFYQGELGQSLIRACEQGGGHLRADDLQCYRVIRRQPLRLRYHQAQLFSNPAPSVGGTLMAFTLSLLQSENLQQFQFGSYQHLARVANAQRLTQQLRREKGIDRELTEQTSRALLDDKYLHSYRATLRRHHQFPRGTTQISIADSAGNLASMTLSNGEGSGFVIPQSGIMTNNMLGEEDINPHGFNQWPEDSRIASMMSPTLVQTADSQLIATGSGGSNRIRSAILQTLINLIDFNMDVASAVEQSRLHFEGELLNLEQGYTEATLDPLFEAFPTHRLWPGKNLFFGGAHTVSISDKGVLSGSGDSRRGGVCIHT